MILSKIWRPRSKNGRTQPVFEEFVIDLDIQAKFHNFGWFLADLEQRLPYARIDQLSIRGERSRAKNGADNKLRINMQYGILRFTATGLPKDKYPPAAPIPSV